MNEKISTKAKRLPWSARRSGLIAGMALREAVRMKLFLALVILALAAFSSSFVFESFNFGSSELKFIADFGFGGISLFGSVLTVLISVQLFMGEMEHRTILTLLAKPVRRSEYVVGKALGCLGAISSFVAMLIIALALALWIRESQLMAMEPEFFPEGRIVPYLDLLLYGVVQVFRFAILSALVILFCTYASSPLFAMLMGLLVWVAGQMQHLALDAWNATHSLLGRTLYALVSLILPNFHLFDLGDKLALGEGIAAATYGKAIVYAALYVGFYLMIACLSFKRREI